jgi:hypothetical protein
MAYIILVENDGTLYGSCKTKIMQKEKLFNKLWFLVPPHYNGYDMSQCTVTMRYLLPISREFVTETLTLSDEKYEEYLKYVLPVDTNLTKEHGNIELNLTFTMLDVDDNGNIIQRVRKTDNHLLNITPIPNWDSVIPDSSLSALDQRILKQDAQIRALADLAYLLNDNQVDNLVYDSKEDVLHLSANGVRVGNKVSVKDMIDDGIPVVDLDSNDSNSKPEGDCDCGCEHEDNVVEFGDLEDSIVEKLEDDNVVEF